MISLSIFNSFRRIRYSFLSNVVITDMYAWLISVVSIGSLFPVGKASMIRTELLDMVGKCFICIFLSQSLFPTA